jgi:hypothetical protein
MLTSMVFGSGLAVRADEKPELKTYVNSKAGLTGALSDNYIDFSFKYPAEWKLIDRSKDPSNFVKVEREIGEGKDAMTQENFAVGHFTGSGNAEADKVLIPQLLEKLDTQLKAGFPNYKKTAEGATKFGDYEGRELRFTSEFKPPGKDPITIWGRGVLIPDPMGGKVGAFVIMLATSLAPELKEEKDLGVKGQLPAIVKSFKLGK